jgi:hypothetical protein
MEVIVAVQSGTLTKKKKNATPNTKHSNTCSKFYANYSGQWRVKPQTNTFKGVEIDLSSPLSSGDCDILRI